MCRCDAAYGQLGCRAGVESDVWCCAVDLDLDLNLEHMHPVVNDRSWVEIEEEFADVAQRFESIMLSTICGWDNHS